METPNGLGGQCRATLEKIKAGELKTEGLLGKQGDPSTADEKNKSVAADIAMVGLSGFCAKKLKVGIGRPEAVKKILQGTLEKDLAAPQKPRQPGSRRARC